MTTHAGQMTRRASAFRLDLAHYLPSVLLAGYGAFILSLFVRGVMTMYINPAYVWPTTAAGVALVLAAAVRLRWPAESGEECCDDCAAASIPRLWPYLVLAIPLLLAAVLPPRSLAAFSARQRGVQIAGLTTMTGATTLKRVSLSVDTRSFSLQDWAGALAADPNPKDYAGKAVIITGMVLHDPASMPPGYIMVMRYQVTCCIADARAEGMVVRDTSHGALKDGQWVHVQGTMGSASDDGQKMPVVEPARMTQVKAGNPYMY